LRWTGPDIESRIVSKRVEIVSILELCLGVSSGEDRSYCPRLLRRGSEVVKIDKGGAGA